MKWLHSLSTRKRMLLVFLAILLAPLILFVINGTLLAQGENPVYATTSHSAAPASARLTEVKVMAYNIAKCFAHAGGLRFAGREEVQRRVAQLAAVINREKPDLVFLSEAIYECSPCPVNQVAELAEATGMHSLVFGENYNFGLPFYRVVGGNAILSQWPLTPLDNPSLAGRKPFWKTQNNRRVLWASVSINGEEILLASVHTDSYSRTNNARQTQQILDYAGGRPAILAGDFNATPSSRSIRLLLASQRFSGSTEGGLTFPSEKPDRRIDYIFAPKEWQLKDQRILDVTVSDHRPIVATFALP